MPDLNSQEFKNLVAGNDFTVSRILKNLPAGDSIKTAWFTVKLRKEDLDAEAIFQKEVTVVATVDGQITDAAAGDRVGQVVFFLKAADTIKLKEHKEYWFDLKFRTAAGLLNTPEMGTFTVRAPVTLAEGS